MAALLRGVVAIGFLAVGRVRLPARQKALVLAEEATLGGIVIELERTAHA